MYINREALENQGVEINVTDEHISFEFSRGRELDTRSVTEQLHEGGLATSQVDAIISTLHADAHAQMVVAAISRSHAYVPPNKHKPSHVRKHQRDLGKG